MTWLNRGYKNAKDLIKIVANNFVCDISSPNGKSSSHSLAMIIMQPAEGDQPLVGDTIMRLKTPILNDHELPVYIGPKKPELPCMPMDTVSAEFQELQAMSQRRSDENK